MPIYKDSITPSVVKKITLDGHEHKVSKILLMDDVGDEHNIWRTKRLVRFMSYDGSQEYSHGWYNKGDLVTKPSITPQRSPTETSTVQIYYTFVGWSTSPNATSGIDPNNDITLETDNDVSYYAAYKWTRYLINDKTKYGTFSASGNYGRTKWAGRIQTDSGYENYANGYVYIFQGSADKTYGSSQTCKTGISLAEIKKYNTLTVKYYTGGRSNDKKPFDVGLWGSSTGITSANAVVKASIIPTETIKTATISLSSLHSLTTPTTFYFGFGALADGTTSGTCAITEVKFTS